MLDKPVPIVFAWPFLGVGFLWQQMFVAGVDFPWFLLESLILAQDERWRRA